MVVKVKESFEKTRQIKNNDKSKKYILRGLRNTRYHEKILSNKKKSYIYHNLSKFIVDTGMIFSTYTKLLTSYPTTFHLYL